MQENEEQKERDRKIRSKRIKSNYRILKDSQLWKLKFANYLIEDLKNYGPANIIHVEALSRVIKKPIRIWEPDGHLYKTINNEKFDDSVTDDSVNIEYHEQSWCIGHWTLLSNRDPTLDLHLNGCLFSVVGSQIGKCSSTLRSETIDFLTKNSKNLIKQIDKFVSTDKNVTRLMSGGARYIGRSPRDAKKILDNSQGVYCHACRYPGHPRGHASCRETEGDESSVENYSRSTGQRKSGFLSRSDQDQIAHLLLSHRKAQSAMHNLNTGIDSVTVTVTRTDLLSSLPNPRDSLPKMKDFYNGEPVTAELDIGDVIAVLRHHKNEQQNPMADVFVHTIYPKR